MVPRDRLELSTDTPYESAALPTVLSGEGLVVIFAHSNDQRINARCLLQNAPKQKQLFAQVLDLDLPRAFLVLLGEKDLENTVLDRGRDRFLVDVVTERDLLLERHP